MTVGGRSLISNVARVIERDRWKLTEASAINRCETFKMAEAIMCSDR